MDYGGAAGWDSLPPPAPADRPAGAAERPSAEPRATLAVGTDTSVLAGTSPAGITSTGAGAAGGDFAASQRAGLSAIFGLAEDIVPPRPASAWDPVSTSVQAVADLAGILVRPGPVPDAARVALQPVLLTLP